MKFFAELTGHEIIHAIAFVGGPSRPEQFVTSFGLRRPSYEAVNEGFQL